MILIDDNIVNGANMKQDVRTATDVDAFVGAQLKTSFFRRCRSPSRKSRPQ